MKSRLWVPVIFVTVSLLGCGKEVDYKEIQVVNGLMYKMNDSDPYTGVIKEDPLLLSEIHEDSFTYKAILDVQSGGMCTSEVAQGKYDGEKTCRLKENKIAELVYKNGLLDGTRKVWNPKTGKLLAESHLKDGKKHGLNTEYFSESGNKYLEENYENGKLSGHQKKWGSLSKLPDGSVFFEESELTSDLDWNNGKKSGMTLTLETLGIRDVYQKSVGNVTKWVGHMAVLEENWKDDVLDGTKKEYIVDIENPKERILKYEGSYKNGSTVGTHKVYSGKNVVTQKEYDEKGIPTGGFERMYQNGNVISEIKLLPVSDENGKMYLGKNGAETLNINTKEGGVIHEELEWDHGRLINRSVKESINGNQVSESNFSAEKDNSTGEYSGVFMYEVDLNANNPGLKPVEYHPKLTHLGV